MTSVPATVEETACVSGEPTVVSVHAVCSSGSGAAACLGPERQRDIGAGEDQPGLLSGHLVAADVAERREVGRLQVHQPLVARHHRGAEVGERERARPPASAS